MKRMASTSGAVALAVLASVALLSPAFAQDAATDCSRLRKCAGLSDDENRLACYDGLMKAATAAPDEPARNLFGPPQGGAKPGAKREQAGQRAARAPKVTEERRKGLHCLSAWDGSHILLKRHVRRSLREPGSFEHIATQIWPVSKAGTHRLRMRFHARNGFGGMSVASVLAEIENDGCAFTILETLAQ